MPTYGSQNLGTTVLGPPLQDAIPAKPLLATLYDVNGNFIKSLGPILERPPFQWTLNAGGHPITVRLPAQDTSATAPVPGNQLYLREDGGDGSIRYRGIIEDVPETLDVKVAHELSVQPMVVELGNAPVNKAYLTATDVAQMVRDAVSSTQHLSWSPASVPLSGLTAIWNFVHVTALDVMNQAKLLAGVNYWWFVDRTGLVWFQSYNSALTAKTTLLRGQHFNVRRSSAPITKQINHIVCMGGVPAEATFPITSVYDGASQATIGTRAAKQPYVYPTVADQGTLDAIKNTLGAALDRQLTKVELDKIVNQGPIELGVVGGPSVRYWEPAADPMVESSVGKGTYQGPYVTLDVIDYGTHQKVIAADIPINGVDDFKFTIDRLIQQTMLQFLSNSPVSASQMSLLGNGGFETAVAPPGVPWTSRIKADATAIRGYNGQNVDYGLPDGVGETFRLGTDGIAWFAALLLQSAKTGARIVLDTKTDPNNPIIQLWDPGNVDRVQIGSLSAYTDPNGVVSPAQWGTRWLDSSGNLLADAVGIAGTASILGGAYNFNTGYTNSSLTPVVVTGVTATFSLTRKSNVWVVVNVSGQLAGAAGNFAYGTVFIDGTDYGHANNGAKVVFDKANPGYTNGNISLIRSLASGSHTIDVRVNVDNAALTWTNYQVTLDIIRLGG